MAWGKKEPPKEKRDCDRTGCQWQALGKCTRHYQKRAKNGVCLSYSGFTCWLQQNRGIHYDVS